MPAEGTTETTATTAETTATTAVETTTPASFIDAEGNVTEGWKEQYVPEEYRTNPVFDRAKTIQTTIADNSKAAFMLSSLSFITLPPWFLWLLASRLLIHKHPLR